MLLHFIIFAKRLWSEMVTMPPSKSNANHHQPDFTGGDRTMYSITDRKQLLPQAWLFPLLHTSKQQGCQQVSSWLDCGFKKRGLEVSTGAYFVHKYLWSAWGCKAWVTTYKIVQTSNSSSERQKRKKGVLSPQWLGWWGEIGHFTRGATSHLPFLFPLSAGKQSGN